MLDMDILYNVTSDSFYNNVGVNIRPMDFGGMKGVDYLDHDPLGNGISQTAYFAPLIADLVAAGFKVGHNLFGAPYDWRRGDHVPEFRAALKQLIERAYSQTGNKKVHIVAHSMGNLHTGVFLSQQTQAWKDKFIGSFVAVAGPWSGAPMALRTIVSGNNLGATVLGINLIDPLRVRQLARQAGGVVWCMPDVEFWNTTELIRTPTGSYNAETLPTLFAQLGTSVTSDIYDHTVKIHDIPAPNVELHCLYGSDYPTEMHYTYKNGFDKDPEITYSNDGDGVVPAQSLQKCNEFAKKQTQPVEIKEFDLAGHMNILYDEELLQYVLKLVSIPARK
jgi:lysophospholipase III